MTEQDENWCWCNKCQGLFYVGNPTFGVCPAGGQHDSSGSANYSLTYGGDVGQQGENWCWCNKCEGLFYVGNPTFGVCPAGGQHDSSGSANYSLTYGEDVGQQYENWCWCNKCEGLFYAGPEQPLGVCPAGGRHDPSAYLSSSPEEEEQPSYEAPPNPYEQNRSNLSDPESALSPQSSPRRRFRQTRSVLGPALISNFSIWSTVSGLTENPMISIPFFRSRSRLGWGGPRLIGLIFMGFGLLLAVIGLLAFINTRNFLQGTVTGQGRIVSCYMLAITYSDGSVSYECRPTVRFTTASGQEINFVSSDASNLFHEGENVPVRYHSDSPQDALISSFTDLWLLPLILGGCGGLFFLIGLVVVFKS